MSLKINVIIFSITFKGFHSSKIEIFKKIYFL